MRNEIYTLYKNYHLPVRSNPADDILIFYIGKECPFSNFKKSNFSDNEFYLSVNELTNAYWVRSFGIYRGEKVFIFGIPNNFEGMIRVVTESEELAKKWDFQKVQDNWFLKDINKAEIQKAWEERSAALNLPMPEGLDKIKDIDLSKEK